MSDPEREERRPGPRSGEPETLNLIEHNSAGPWWSWPPHQISPEMLDELDRALGRGAGLLEVAGSLAAEVAA